MMPQEMVFLGVDVAKRTLEICALGEAKSRQTANGPGGWARLVKLCSERATVVGVEPSGGYETGLVRALVGAGIEVRWRDPARVRALAKALGAPAKTDAIDARMIARYLAEAGGRPVQLDEDRQALRELLAARTAATDTAQRLTLQAQGLAGEPRQMIERLAAEATATAKALTRQLLEAIRQRPQLLTAWRLLQSAPGVGPLVAAELLADMPELGRVSGKAIAKLAGLAPRPGQGGCHGAQPPLGHCLAERGRHKRDSKCRALPADPGHRSGRSSDFRGGRSFQLSNCRNAIVPAILFNVPIGA